MTIVSQEQDLRNSISFAIKEKDSNRKLKSMLQCRLAKDGSDEDIQQAFESKELKRLDITTSDRMKTLIRLGLEYEQIRLLEKTIPQNKAVQDVAPKQVIVARIGSHEHMLTS